MRALLRFWLLGDALTAADHARLDHLSGRFAAATIGATGAIGAIHLIRLVLGVHL